VGGSSSTGGAVATGGTGTSGLFLDGFFPIGTFMPTMDEFQKWKDRGVNTMVGEAGAVDVTTIIAQWDATAKQLGLKEIRHALPNPADDIGNPNLLAWAQNDEPDASGQGYVNSTACMSRYTTLKSVDPKRPIYINFGGSDVMSALDGAAPSWCPSPYTDCLLTSTYKLLLAAGDWISNDRYPLAGYLNTGATRGDLTLVSQPVDRLAGWSNKPQFDYIETSNQQIISGARGVTPDELRAEVWLSIVHGVRGFVYFPQVVGGSQTSNDGTPADVVTEMTKVNTTVTQIASVLQGAINPPSISAVPPAPLQAGWRNAPSGMYFIVVNPVATVTTASSIALTGVGAATAATVLNENRTVPISGGKISDGFAAFGVHIYVVASSGGGLGTGGATGTGGAVGAGGATSSGGATSTGGKTSTGGTGSAGGAMSTGGTGSVGGVASTGGTGSAGGVASTGGVTSAGGSSSTGGAVATGGTATSGLFLNGFFPIGTYMPTMDEFQKWKDRGVNTLVEEAGAADVSTIIVQWDSMAKQLGLKEIRRPLPIPANDIGNPNLLAWMQEDEPDANGQGYINSTTCASKYSTWKGIDPTRPVYINFGGSDVMGALDGAAPSWCPSPYTDCMLTSTYQSLIAAADWISNDRYPVTGYLNDGVTRGDLTLVAQPLDRLATWTSKPLFNYIETSSQQIITGARGVTPDELRAEVWLSIVHGVRGFVYFPQVVGGSATTNDGTPADVATEMTKVNATVTQIAAVLQGAINPSGIAAIPPAPLQAGWRNAASGMYFMVVNPVATVTTASSITLTGVGAATTATVLNENRTVPISGGKISDGFAAFGVHIYVVGK
jgi:hypothetical protein